MGRPIDPALNRVLALTRYQRLARSVYQWRERIANIIAPYDITRDC